MGEDLLLAAGVFFHGLSFRGRRALVKGNKLANCSSDLCLESRRHLVAILGAHYFEGGWRESIGPQHSRTDQMGHYLLASRVRHHRRGSTAKSAISQAGIGRKTVIQSGPLSTTRYIRVWLSGLAVV